MATEKDLPVGLVRLDGDTQARVGNDEATIAEYTEMAREGRRPPPIDVFFDGEAYYPGDGHHRLEAFRRAGQATIPCRIHEGTLRDARLFSTAANAGLRRTNADKRNAVAKTLRETLRETPGWSDGRVAAHCHVTDKTVKSVREELFPETVNAPRKGRDDKERRPPQRQPKATPAPAPSVAPVSWLPNVSAANRQETMELFNSKDVKDALAALPPELQAFGAMFGAAVVPKPVAPPTWAELPAWAEVATYGRLEEPPPEPATYFRNLRRDNLTMEQAAWRRLTLTRAEIAREDAALERWKAERRAAKEAAAPSNEAEKSATPPAQVSAAPAQATAPHQPTPKPYEPIMHGAGAELAGLRTGVPPLKPSYDDGSAKAAHEVAGFAEEQAALEKWASKLAVADARAGIRREGADAIQAGLEAEGSEVAKFHRAAITAAYSATWEASPKGPPPPTPLELAQKEIDELHAALDEVRARLDKAEDERAAARDEVRRLREDAGDCGLVVCEGDDCPRLALPDLKGAALCKRCSAAAAAELITVRDELPAKAKASRARRAR